MTVLYRNRELAVTTLRNALDLTDGNLASHLSKLEEVGYVKTGRVLVGVSFEVHAKITDTGSVAFKTYLATLRSFLEAADEPETAPLMDTSRAPADSQAG